MLAQARGRAGCDDFGDSGFRAAARRDDRRGRGRHRSRPARPARDPPAHDPAAHSRLLVEDLVRRRPEILDIDSARADHRDRPAPLGHDAPREPHRRRHPAAVPPLLGEPRAVPAPGDGPGRDGVDPRFARCRRDYDAQMQMVPLLRAMHHQYPTAIEEEIELQDLDFSSYTLEWLARVPRGATSTSPSISAHYAYTKKVLQVLTFLRGPNRWVLKSPQHLEQIPALLATFPDATFAITHRDPVSVIQSAITMLAYGDRMRRAAIEPEALAAYWVDRIDRLLRACVRDRDLLPADRQHRRALPRVHGRRRGHGRADLRTQRPRHDPDARAELDAFMAANPRGKHGHDLATGTTCAGSTSVLEPADVRRREAVRLLLRALPGAGGGRMRPEVAAVRIRGRRLRRDLALAPRRDRSGRRADHGDRRRRPRRRPGPAHRRPHRRGAVRVAHRRARRPRLRRRAHRGPPPPARARRDRGARRRTARDAREAARAHARRVRSDPRRRERAGTVFMVAENAQYWPEVLTVRDLIHDGAIGEVVTARAATFFPRSATSTAATGPWRFDQRGGRAAVVIDTGSHWLRPLRVWLGEVDEVVAALGHPHPDMEGESLCRALLRFESGVVATFDAMLTTGAIANQPLFTVTGSAASSPWKARAG